MAGVVAIATVVASAAGWSTAAIGEDMSAAKCAGTGKPGATTVSRIQALQFELMELSSFNSFDGVRVVRDLRRNRQLWCGAIMDRPDSLIQLRDIDANHWNVDTLFVLSSGVDDKKLRAIAARWSADEVSWISGRQADDLLGSWGAGSKRILVVWWD